MLTLFEVMVIDMAEYHAEEGWYRWTADNFAMIASDRNLARKLVIDNAVSYKDFVEDVNYTDKYFTEKFSVDYLKQKDMLNEYYQEMLDKQEYARLNQVLWNYVFNDWLEQVVDTVVNDAQTCWELEVENGENLCNGGRS